MANVPPRPYSASTIPGPTVHTQRATIEVRRIRRLTKPEWEVVRSTSLGLQMVRNRVTVFNMESPFSNNYSRGTGGAMLAGVEKAVREDYYLDVADEGGRWVWTFYFESEADRDELMVWLKLKFDGVQSSVDYTDRVR